MVYRPQPHPKSALGRVRGYPKRKTDPIFEIPTVENHRIDVLHDFFTFYSIFAVTAALAATASLLGRSGDILKEKPTPFLKSPPFETIEFMYHMIFYMFFSIFAVTAAPAATATDETEKLPVLGVVLLKRSHHTKNQPDPSIIVARAD